MKKVFIILSVTVFSFLLVACANLSQPKQPVDFSATEGKENIQGDVIIYGLSNLPKGAKVKLTMTVMETREVVVTEIVDVIENGEFRWAKMGIRPKQIAHELKMEFIPEEQSEEIQKKYGSKGEFITEDSKGLIQYTKDNNTYQAIKLYTGLHKLGKNPGGVVANSGGYISFDYYQPEFKYYKE